MGSLLENPWVLAGAGLILEFLLLCLTYRAGYMKAKEDDDANLIDILQAENDALRRYTRSQALRSMLDSAKISSKPGGVQILDGIPPTPPEKPQ